MKELKENYPTSHVTGAQLGQDAKIADMYV